jgi:hypothetical protein
MLLARLAMVMAKTAPADTARMVAEQISVGNIQNEAAISVVYQWAQTDPSAARVWVNLFPDGFLRTRALNELTNIQNQQVANPQ